MASSGEGVERNEAYSGPITSGGKTADMMVNGSKLEKERSC